MPSTSMTSRLDAVNTILSASGEQPVSSLANATADVANAEQVLDEISREVQAEGWHFNTDDEVPLTPDDDGLIALAENVLRVDVNPARYSTINPVQRGVRLYDRLNRTYEFDETLTAEVTYCLPFDEMPEQARRYIAVRAARIFHDRYVGSETQHRFTEGDEQRARVSLTAADLSNADVNLFTTNPRYAALATRR